MVINKEAFTMKSMIINIIENEWYQSIFYLNTTLIIWLRLSLGNTVWNFISYDQDLEKAYSNISLRLIEET